MRKAIVLLIALASILLLTACSEHVHSYGEWTVTKRAGCTEEGMQERLCSCGDKQTQTIPATGHNYSVWTVAKAATCTESGENERICSNCGDRQTQAIPATGHNYGEWSVSKQPSCTAAGESVRLCNNCGGKQTQVIASTGHQYGSYTVTKKATCTETGEQARTCNKCGDIQKAKIEAAGHSYGAWKETKAATCKEKGKQERVCTVCGQKQESETELAAHKFGNEKVTLEPTCTIAGSKTMTCQVCGKSEQFAISPLGHDLDSSGKCRRCGFVQLTMTASEINNAKKVEYLNHSATEYSDDIRINIKFLDADKYGIESPAYVDVTIIDDDGNTLYSQTVVKKASMDKIEIKYEDVGVCHVAEGTLYYRVYSDYFEFNEFSLALENLPWVLDASVKLPKTPKTIIEYGYNKSKTAECKVTNITYKVTRSSIRFYVTGQKTYDTNGSDYSRACHIGYKIYDPDGYVIKSGTLYTEQLKTGEKFRDEEIWVNVSLPGVYTLEILNVD